MTTSPTPSTDEMDDLEALEQQAAAAAAALERQKAALAKAKKAKEEAAAAEKKRQEEAAAAEKKAQEEAAAAEKKAAAEAAVAAKKAAAEAAAAEKKAAADAKKAARSASQSASPTRPEYADVKVEMTPVAEDDMPMPAKLTHVLAIVVSAVIVLCVSAVLADGTSVIKLKDPMHLKVATNPALKSLGFNHRLDELLGPTYGVGLHHDQAGYSWTDVKAGSTLRELIQNLGLPVIAAALPSVIATDALKHPVTLLSCDGLKAACLSAMVLGFVALSAAVVMVAFHAAALAGLIPSAKAKPFAALVWFVLTAGFLTVVLLAVGIYASTWECKNEIIPELKLSDHFEYNYGFHFACVGYVSSLLMLLVVASFTSTRDNDTPNIGAGAVKVAGGVVGGLTFSGLLVLVVLAVTWKHDLENVKPVDPNLNPCAGQKPYNAGPDDHYFDNVACFKEAVTQTLEQAGANVTRGYKGGMDAGGRVPITKHYTETDLCPVNVHWHLGAEHLSVGQYDAGGHGPGGHRQLAAGARLGHRCHHYDASDAKFTTEYNWQHCVDMHVGETYEVHWPHSAAGACGTKWQYQTPFYDGVFCNDGVISIAPLNTYEKIGVQGQVFTIVNDETYYQADMMKGALSGGDFWSDVAMYTGSTTGTSRDNQICSRYTPITWQVDRKCHMISASSFDKLCADMKAIADDMSGDLYAHGAREVVATSMVANNQQSRK